MVRWMRWKCPPDTGFDIRALAVWSRVRYLSVTQASLNIESLRVNGGETFSISLKLEDQSGVRARDLRLSKQAASTTAPWPPLPRCDSIICANRKLTWKNSFLHLIYVRVTSWRVIGLWDLGRDFTGCDLIVWQEDSATTPHLQF